jgi:alkylation response protein AidB-like acyl-CoA dehydrogenase
MTVTETNVQSEVKAWLDENWDPERPVGDWWKMLADSGWGFPHYPVEWSGRGLPSDAESIVTEELAAKGAFGPPWGVATMMVGPLLLELGTEEQRERWLEGIVDGTDIWCQLFSEPEAGSDLAGLKTTAVRDGDEWIINGQKVWTSGAIDAKRAILVARTDPDAAKHHGLSFFIIEMDQPGVEVRPLVQMTGESEFNEVFLTNAVVPVQNLIGEINKGWGVTLRLLSYERNSLDPEGEAGLQNKFDLSTPVGLLASGEVDDGTQTMMPKGSEAWAMLLGMIQENGLDTEAPIRQEAMRFYSMLQIARYTSLRAAAAIDAGQLPGSEVSLGKLASVRMMRTWRDLALRVLGPNGQIVGEDAPLGGRVAQIALSFRVCRLPVAPTRSNTTSLQNASLVFLASLGQTERSDCNPRRCRTLRQ